MSDPMRLSVCMIVRNEEHNLPRCFESLQSCADEVIVVDTGSSDRSMEICREYHARVYEFPWQDDFSQARNLSLERANGDWILIIDADEVLAPESRVRLRPLLAETRFDALEMIQHSFNPPWALETYQRVLQVRLLRNRLGYRYIGRIHEQLYSSIQECGGSLGPSDLVIWHYGYLDETAQGNISRQERNRGLLEQALNLEPENAFFTLKLGLLYAGMGQDQPARRLLERAVFDLHALGVEPGLLQSGVVTLARLAYQQGDYLTALRAAELGKDLPLDEVRALLICSLLAQASLAVGQQLVQAVTAAGTAQSYDLEQLQAARRHLLTARVMYQRLGQYPALTPEMSTAQASGLRAAQDLDHLVAALIGS